MDHNIKPLLETQYGIPIHKISDAPRQFVAETYFIEDDTGKKYFCKIVTKPLFIPHIIESLPVLKNMHKCGLEKITYPIPTQNGELYIQVKNTLIVLFNYIDAHQSSDYSTFAFGQLLATVHKMTTRLTVPLPKENFLFKYEGKFEAEVKKILETYSSDQITQSLKVLLSQYDEEIRHDYKNFMHLNQQLRRENHMMVITHGDPGGNVLATSPADLYLIDWDDILLSPPERDTWFFQNDPDFIRGYQTVFPGYEVNQELNHFFMYKRYFEDLIEYFAEINNDMPDEHRIKNLKKLEHDCFEGWLRPAIRRFDPYSIL